MVASLQRPGVVVEHFESAVAAEFRTGVAGFLGFAVADAGASPPTAPESRLYTRWHDFAYQFRDDGGWRPGAWRPDELLWGAVQGFFGNGGRRCYVVFYDPASTGDPRKALDRAVQALAEHEEIDLICAPSLMAAADPGPLQQQLIKSSELARRAHAAEWFLILDGPPPSTTELGDWLATLREELPEELRAPRDCLANAALYHPWLIPGGEFEPPPGATATSVPPSGHVAGIFARTDRRIGVHKAPANEEVLGVADVVSDDPDVEGTNPLRAFPGRGIRVWGARTLAEARSSSDPDGWVNMRRLVLTLERWLVRALEWVVFETNDFRLWVRIHRELEARLTDLFLRGAFQGKTPQEAFRIKCDDENNPADARASGRLQIDIQIAPAVPQQFVQIRLIRSAEGLTAL
jgi:hypothetical protein